MARSLLLILCGAAALLNAAGLAVVLSGQVPARPAVLLALAIVLLLPLLLAATLMGRRRSPYLGRATRWFVGLQLLGVLAVGLLVARGALDPAGLRPVLLAALDRPPEPLPLELANRPGAAPTNPGLYGWQFQQAGSTRVVDSLEQVPTALRGRATRIRILRPGGAATPTVGGAVAFPPEHQRLLEELNQHRLAAGLARVALDPTLSLGCQAHAEYLARNYGDPETEGLRAHGQDRRLPGSSEEGAAAAAQSTIAHSTDTSAVAMWMATLYHRAPLLDPRLRRIGLGLAEVPPGRPTLPARLPPGFRLLTTVMNVAQREQPATTVVLYPAEGQEEVPRSFGEGEVPNPLTLDADGRAGFPISVTFFQAAGGTPRLLDARATLRDDRGQPVPVHLHLPDRPLVPGYGEDTIGLIPQDLLRPRTGYQVEVEAQVEGTRWRRSWRFTTGA